MALDRALKLCALTHGDQPFHLLLAINPPAPDDHGRTQSASPTAYPDMRAEVEVFWLNPLTYRTVVRSPHFTQTRIVNVHVVEEHDTGDFYPRWLQNFVDALIEPVPNAPKLRRLAGSIPVSRESHACISTAATDAALNAQVCFQDSEPRLASDADFGRYVSFDDFQPFGDQQIPRTLVNDLPASVLVRGHVLILEPLRSVDNALIKAKEFTPLKQQIRTQLVSSSQARELLGYGQLDSQFPATRLARTPSKQLISYTPARRLGHKDSTPLAAPTPDSATNRTVVYVRTDRTGRVREAYPDSADIYGLHKGAVARAFNLKFKPLIVNGVPQQMEGPIDVQ